MNPSLQTNSSAANQQVNQSMRSAESPNTFQQVRPVRMEPPRPVGNNYQQNYRQQNPYQFQNIQNYQQQQQQQQQIMLQNQQRQLNMQQNLRFPSVEDSIRSQINPSYNSHPAIQDNHRNSGGQFEGQRMQVAPQVRPAGPQQQIRPVLNYQNGGNQQNLQNYQRNEVHKTSNDRNQAYFQNTENFRTQAPRDSLGNLTRKSSELEMKLPSLENNNQRPKESVLSVGLNDRKPDQQKLLLSATTCEPESVELPAESSESFSTKLENDEAIKTSETKKIKQENKTETIKDETITSGMVQKNIKFFEENDTAKIPLKPEAITLKKSKVIREVPDNVVKSDTNKNKYESGVDETPVVHPNLGSIFQVPRKVAKIPYSKGSKGSRVLKLKRLSDEPLHKRRNYHRPPFSEFLKPGYSYLPHKPGKKIQTVKNCGSKEELLAFFENTILWRKLNCYRSKGERNESRDNLVHKPTTNGDIPTPKKTPSKVQTPRKNPSLSPTKTPLKSPGTPITPGTPGAKSLPKTPESPAPPTPLIKKVPMNKIQVGAAPSPNLKTVKSKVGSLANTTHKPGGGNVKIESHKIDLSKVQPKTEAKNEMYKPSGGEKKIQQVKLQWSAKSKIGSLENATYKPGGGDKKIESVKLDFKEKAKPKVGSKDNVKHVPGGGNVKIDNQKLEFKAQSKIGSLDNVKHKPGGGDIKIFDDKTYLRQISGTSSEGRASGTQALSDLTIVQEVEGRSAPGTPGRHTSVKVRKVTTIENSGGSPKIKNITKVTVTSQTPKKEKYAEKSPAKQHVKVTYSKISSLKKNDSDLPLGIVRLPAKDSAPVLKSSLSKKDFDDPDAGKQTYGNEIFDFNKTVSNKSARITLDLTKNSASPNLRESKSNRDDTGRSKFAQDETVNQEKIGEMWRERNAVDVKSNPVNTRPPEEQQKELSSTFSSENYEHGSNIRKFTSQNPGESQINPNESRSLNIHSSQNMKSDTISLNPAFVIQQEGNINQQNSYFPP